METDFKEEFSILLGNVSGILELLESSPCIQSCAVPFKNWVLLPGFGFPIDCNFIIGLCPGE